LGIFRTLGIKKMKTIIPKTNPINDERIGFDAIKDPKDLEIKFDSNAANRNKKGRAITNTI